MSDEIPPANAATAASGTATNEPAEAQTFSVSKEDWDKTQKTLNSLAAMLRKSQQAPAPAAAVAAAVEDEPKTQKEALAKLQADLKAQTEAMVKAQRETDSKTRRNGIRDAMTALGIVEPTRVKILFNHLEGSFGSNIKLSGDEVVYTDALDQTKEIGEFLGDFLKTPEGAIFKPEKVPGPNTRAGRGNSAAIPGQKSYMEMSLTERLALSPEQLKAAMQS